MHQYELMRLFLRMAVVLRRVAQGDQNAQRDADNLLDEIEKMTEEWEREEAAYISAVTRRDYE